MALRRIIVFVMFVNAPLSLSLVVVAVAVSISACSDDVTRRDVAASLTELVIPPRYEAADDAQTLDSRVRALVAEPTADNLAGARGAWRDARSAWSRVQAYTLGPVMERRISSLVDWWPIDDEKIHAAIARPSISAEKVRANFAADQRGFRAIE